MHQARVIYLLSMKFGTLQFEEISDHPSLLGKPVLAELSRIKLVAGVMVAEIDPALADTAAFCDHYQIAMSAGANCVIVEAKRADRVWYGACLVLATTRVDVNGAVRRYLEARKISFAPMETAVRLSNMEYGGITPIGLPEDWPILVDEVVLEQPRVVIGSGVRGSKLLVEPQVLRALPAVKVMKLTK